MQSGTSYLVPIVSLVIAYITGSIPSAYLAGKWKGVDLRKHGSGNLGATNVVRVLGPRIGALVFAVDILKGFLPVWFLPPLSGHPHDGLLALCVGIAAILGHVKPVFLWHRGGGGGKGVATAAGVFLGLAPVATLIALAVWLLVFALWRYVSAASLAAAATLPVALLLWLLLRGNSIATPVWLASVAIAAFVFYTHRANIGRLRRGEEHAFRREVAPR